MQGQLLLIPLGQSPLSPDISSEDGLGVHPRDKAASDRRMPLCMRVISLAAAS